MVHSRRRTAHAVAWLSIPLLGWVVLGPANGQEMQPPGRGWHPTAAEIAQLPQFCWAQFTENKGPEYQIPRSCGSGMNHYCPGLVEQLRAKRSYSDQRKRLGYLYYARRRTLYTLKAMEKEPNCPIRQHVETTLMVVDAQWKGAGGGQKK
jgi:hypothetical protein